MENLILRILNGKTYCSIIIHGIVFAFNGAVEKIINKLDKISTINKAMIKVKAEKMQNQTNLALKNNFLFKDTDISSLTLDGLDFSIINLSEGEVLFKNGDFATSIYLIVDGEISLLKKQNFSKTVSSTLNKDEFFGQDEFFTNSERTSTALAVKDTQLAELSKENINILLSQHNSILGNLKTSVESNNEVLNSLDQLLIEAKENSKDSENKVSIFDVTSQKGEDELKRLNQLKKKDTLIENLKGKIEKYSRFVKKKEKQITDLYERIEDYQSSNKQLNNLMETQHEQLTRLLDSESVNKESLEVQTVRVTNLEKELEELRKENPGIEAKLVTNEETISELETKISTFEKIEDSRAKIEQDYVEQLNYAKNEITRLTKKAEDNNNSKNIDEENKIQLKESQSEILELKSEITELKKNTVVDSSLLIEEHESIIQERENIISNLQAKLERVLEVEAKQTDDKKEISNQVEKIKEENVRLEAELKRNQEKLYQRDELILNQKENEKNINSQISEYEEKLRNNRIALREKEKELENVSHIRVKYETLEKEKN
ncbi:MAG: cyclic nucleotide-binding domain-containing protein, partial [Ignavibacteriae bacterium]|nr:cyclic nucleotide-binding domain-containing protein [Ignavibacteriota bacterium]